MTSGIITWGRYDNKVVILGGGLSSKMNWNNSDQSLGKTKQGQSFPKKNYEKDRSNWLYYYIKEEGVQL